MKLLDNIIMVRVISGTAKNKRLIVPEVITRPITDRIKTSLFDTIGNALEGADILDLFAGSGGFGIETLSRGAAHATFVDKNSAAIEIIRENLINTALFSNATLVREHVKKFLATNTTKYHIVFLDPPFGLTNTKKINLLRLALESITPNGLVIYRYPIKDSMPAKVTTDDMNFKSILDKRYGQSAISFYRAS